MSYLKYLAQAIQQRFYFEAKADEEAKIEAATDAARELARETARTLGWIRGLDAEQIAELENRAAKNVPRTKSNRDIDAEMPTRAWCERIAKKHAQAARAANRGDRRAFRDDLMARVKADPDAKGKTKGKVTRKKP